MTLLPKFVESDHDLVLEEFDKQKHMIFAKDIMDMDEELTNTNKRFQPGQYIDDEIVGKVTYQQYIDLLLDNNWRLFVAILNGRCIGYIHTVDGRYKDSVYVGSFIVTKKFTNKGYGKEMMKQFESLIRKDYKLIFIMTAADNKPAVNLYNHSGFRVSHLQMYKKIK